MLLLVMNYSMSPLFQFSKSLLASVYKYQFNPSYVALSFFLQLFSVELIDMQEKIGSPKITYFFHSCPVRRISTFFASFQCAHLYQRRNLSSWYLNTLCFLDPLMK